MKKIKEFIKRQIADEVLLVPTGQTAQEFNGMITLSDTGEFIWDHIEESVSLNDLIDKVVETYEIDRQTASQDVTSFLMQLLRSGMVRPDSAEW